MLRVTPPMAARISEKVMNWTDIIQATDADQPPKKRGPCKKTVEEISNRDTTFVSAPLSEALPTRRGSCMSSAL